MSAPGGRQGGGSYGCAVLAPYTSVVLLSFGGPEGRAEVMPFLERVTAGRGVPPDRLAEVAEHYYQVGGVSPIHAQNPGPVAALAARDGDHASFVEAWTASVDDAVDSAALLEADATNLKAAAEQSSILAG